jgi:septal ring factor EnvC (AmiA/AmiB activator)
MPGALRRAELAQSLGFDLADASRVTSNSCPLSSKRVLALAADAEAGPRSRDSVLGRRRYTPFRKRARLATAITGSLPMLTSCHPMATLKERVDRHDREIAAIRKLIHAGMKMLVQIEDKVRDLAQSQKETDRQLRETQRTVDRFIRSLDRGNGDGHKSSRVE